MKAAREAKGLSQRDLSAKIGVPQSHISKIESGGSDPKLSSLIELARALDLELALVPRKFIPAVDGIIRSAISEQASAVDASPKARRIAQQARVPRSAINRAPPDRPRPAYSLDLEEDDA